PPSDASSATAQSDSLTGIAPLLDERPPAETDRAARGLASRLVEGYGGRAALEAWLSGGERRGAIEVVTPARVTARIVERRADDRVRIDATYPGGFEASIGM